jgi:NAD(P)-dependent dehydrogenase (short-subunit alcohol dehydrogenase family)
MTPKICVVTGATSGIGWALSQALARQGHRLVLVGRSPEKLQHAEKLLRNSTLFANEKQIITFVADLSRLREVEQLARSIQEKCEHVDVLIHNAGVLPIKLIHTEDGLEQSFVVNHLAPLLLNHHLRSLLIASQPARIVQVSAGIYVKGKINLPGDPYGTNFSPFGTYATSKLWNVCSCLWWAEQLAGTGVTINAVHPGVVRTNLGAMSGIKGWLLDIVKRFWLTPEQGIRGPMHLALAPELELRTGAYFHHEKEIPLDPKTADPEMRAKIIETSYQLAKIRV